MLAIACMMEGQSREDAAETCGIAETRSVCGWDRQTLRDWVHRFNADGLAGLADLPRQNGPKPRLSPEQEAVVTGWVKQGPDLARDGVMRWRCVDLQERIKREWGIACTSARWESPAKQVLCLCCARWRSGACRCARSIRKAIPRRKHVSKRVHRPCSRRPARGSKGQTR